VPLDNIEMIRAPRGRHSAVSSQYRRAGREGELLATIITRPGMADGTIEVRAPQAGLIVTRSSARLVRRRADLMKIACESASKACTQARAAGELSGRTE
jgi:predicted deacylase